MEVQVINLSKNKLPEYESEFSAGMDIRADFSRVSDENPIKCYGYCELSDNNGRKGLFLGVGARALIPTGLKIGIPNGYEVQVRPRSGLALKEGISLNNAIGTIDADYTGEIQLITINNGLETVFIEDGERLAQLVLNKVEKIEWKPVEELKKTERGEGGFGHTGKK